MSHETDRRHPPAAHHREDVDPARGRPDDRVRGGARTRTRSRSSARSRSCSARRSRASAPRIAHGKVKRQGRFVGRRSGLEEGLRQAARGREDAGIPGRGVRSCRFANTIRRRRARGSRPSQTFDEITTQRAAQAAGRAAAQLRRPQQPGRADVVVARRRPQADLPHHRLQARQARHPGEGLDDRVRPEPLGAHRAADVRRRREALHPAAGRAEGRRHDRRRATNVDILPGNCAAAEEHSARHAGPQRRAEAGQGRPDCAQRRVVACSSWPRKATTPR